MNRCTDEVGSGCCCRRGRATSRAFQPPPPFTTHGTAWVDVQTGGLSGSTTLQASDFQSAATVVRGASLTNAASNGSWSEGVLTAAGVLGVNKTGTTQFRVSFERDDNDNARADYVGYYAADNSNAANRPQLVVTYR